MVREKTSIKPKSEPKIKSILDHRNTGTNKGTRYLIKWNEDEFADSWAWEEEIKAQGGGEILKKYMRNNQLNNESHDSLDSSSDNIELTLPENEKESSSDEEEEHKEEDEEYEVEKILDHKKENDDEYMYLVSWVGFPNEESWLKAKDLENSKELLTAYNKKHNISEKKSTKESNYSMKRSKMSGVDPKQSITRVMRRSTAKSYRSASVHSDSSIEVLDEMIKPRQTSRAMRYKNRVSMSKSSTPEEAFKTPPSKINRSEKATRSLRSKITLKSSPTEETATPVTTRNVVSKRGKENDDSAATPAPNKKSRLEKSHEEMASSSEPVDNEPERDSLQPSPARRSPRITPCEPVYIPGNHKQIGLFAGLEVDRLSNLKFNDNAFNKKTSIRVHYKDPIPSEFNSFDTVPVSSVRYLAPQKLLDHYESLLNV